MPCCRCAMSQVFKSIRAADSVSTMRAAFGFVGLPAPIDSGLSSGESLRPPRAAAIAGIVFSVLMAVTLGIFRVAIPSNPASLGAWLIDPGRRRVVSFAIQLIPFSGIAFLWFHRRGAKSPRQAGRPVLCECVPGQRLDVCGLLVCCGVHWRSVAGTDDVAERDSAEHGNLRVCSTVITCVRKYLRSLRMAAVFMFSTCTIALRTAIFPRWIAFLGFTCGLTMLMVIANWAWIALIFPLWMLVVSMQMLFSDLHSTPEKKIC